MNEEKVDRTNKRFRERRVFCLYVRPYIKCIQRVSIQGPSDRQFKINPARCVSLLPSRSASTIPALDITYLVRSTEGGPYLLSATCSETDGEH